MFFTWYIQFYGQDLVLSLGTYKPNYAKQKQAFKKYCIQCKLKFHVTMENFNVIGRSLSEEECIWQLT